MPDLPTSEPEADFVCACEEDVRAACTGEPFYKEHEGKRYCVLHFLGKEKSADFEKALQRKLENKDFNFRGVWFPDRLSFNFEFDGDVDFSFAYFGKSADFRFATFSVADFRSAAFSAAADFTHSKFGDANFGNATFSELVSFNSATLGKLGKLAHFGNAAFGVEANFYHATFSQRANFRKSTFSSANFGKVIFSAPADFSDATFTATADFKAATFSGEANFLNCLFKARSHFSDAVFRDYVKFAGDAARMKIDGTWSLDIQFARFEKPEHCSFHTLALRPHWFVNVDPRKFEFVNVDWRFNVKRRTNIKQELKDLGGGDFGLCASPFRLLAITCQRLAVNAEENQRYEEASSFRYMAMESQRREHWHGFAFWRLSWWYWLASGYGERALRALLVLLVIWFVTASLYTRVGFARWEPKLASEADVAISKRDETGIPLTFSRALTYSAGVMTLQKPEQKPATTTAQRIVLFETILGPVQAALLALAIRRKFMR